MVRSRLIPVFAAVAFFAAAADEARAFCQPVTVYFAWNSTQLSEESKAAIERLAVTLAWKGPDLDQVLLTSHTDATGSPAANRAMALKRARVVRDLLVSYNVPANVIAIRPVGAQLPRVETPAGVREPRNRRVELLVQLSAEGQKRQLEQGGAIC